jgi:hypothetical protein
MHVCIIYEIFKLKKLVIKLPALWSFYERIKIKHTIHNSNGIKAYCLRNRIYGFLISIAAINFGVESFSERFYMNGPRVHQNQYLKLGNLVNHSIS